MSALFIFTPIQRFASQYYFLKMWGTYDPSVPSSGHQKASMEGKLQKEPPALATSEGDPPSLWQTSKGAASVMSAERSGMMPGAEDWTTLMTWPVSRGRCIIFAPFSVWSLLFWEDLVVLEWTLTRKRELRSLPNFQGLWRGPCST